MNCISMVHWYSQVGEDVSLAQVLSDDGSAWKGRAEKMIALQQQLRALQLQQGVAQPSKQASSDESRLLCTLYVLGGAYLTQLSAAKQRHT